jgi:hypothetical protein
MWRAAGCRSWINAVLRAFVHRHLRAETSRHWRKITLDGAGASRRLRRGKCACISHTIEPPAFGPTGLRDADQRRLAPGEATAAGHQPHNPLDEVERLVGSELVGVGFAGQPFPKKRHVGPHPKAPRRRSNADRLEKTAEFRSKHVQVAPTTAADKGRVAAERGQTRRRARPCSV